MKLPALLIALALAGFAPRAIADEEPAIKVTSVLHPDGSRTETQTDVAARTSEEKTFNAAGKLTRSNLYRLDDSGKPAEGVAYDANGKVLYKFVYTRDALGRISEERDFTADGKLIQRFAYRYAPDGRVAGIDAFDGQGNPLAPLSKGQSSPQKKRSAPSRRSR